MTADVGLPSGCHAQVSGQSVFEQMLKRLAARPLLVTLVKCVC